MKRVVVTGLGTVSPVGGTTPEFWASIVAGKSGASRITRFDPAGFDTQIAAEVKGFNPDAYLDKKDVRRTDLFVQFGLAASLEAVKSAGLADPNGLDLDRAGVIVGSGVGGIATLEEQHSNLIEKGPGRVSPFFIPMMIADMAAGMISIRLGYRGPNFAAVSACASGAHAIGEAFRILAKGEADLIVTGGTEAAITPLSIGGFASMKAMSTRNDAPERASRPFDRGRDGFVMGEGAGIAVLEALDHAKSRGAPILAEVMGYGATADAHHMTAPSPAGEGAARAMQLALKEAGLRPESVDYINAHGTSTPMNDKYETMAVKTVFGAHAYELAMSSTKSMTGHLLGAAGGIEFNIAVLAIRDGILPPTINYEDPDPECDLDCVPNQSRRAEVSVVMSNSLGFGGHNVALLVKRYEP
jgi:beta-ketoacyl-acyl-carrier-protein synthase II